MMFFRAFAIWLVLIITESLNGTLRELWLVPMLGEVRAHTVSFVTGAMLILTIATLFSRWLAVTRPSHLMQIGGLWLVLTLGFEVCLGRFILGYSWTRIAADYNLRQGGLMPFGLVWLLLAPGIAAKLRGVLPNQNQPA